MRINHITFDISQIQLGLFNRLDFADWSEDFDSIQKIKNKTLYFNLKFIIEPGGAQNRSIKPIANMIYYCANHIQKYDCDDKYFAFILDGEYLSKFIKLNENNISQMSHQVERVDKNLYKYFYIGNIKHFYDWFKNSI